MQVILRSDVAGLGLRGDIVDVADGHARNFLFPKGHAIKASAGAIEQSRKMRLSRDAKDHESREAATAVASTLVPKTITIAAKASAEGKLFGSIHATEVADAVLEQTGIEIDRKEIEIDHVKTVGSHT
ncbi:MAG: 50S ribosomal protein L9, partial [Ilumatobacter sp.]|nr:50S ribosomal protein L9 [Ilumatobacter sp.]